MQDKPLLISSLLEHAERFHPNVEIVTKTIEGPIHRCNWRELGERSRRLAIALQKRGVRKGSMVATVATNTYRHLELYFAVMGIGAVLHTINPRLSPEHLEYVVNHAEDEILFFDLPFAPLVASSALPGTDAVILTGLPDRSRPVVMSSACSRCT